MIATAAAGGGVLVAALITLVGAALVALPGLGGVRAGRTPRATFDAARRVILEGESYEGLWGLLSAGAREAEAKRIRSLQRAVEARLGRMSSAEREEFERKHGLSPEEHVNLAPPEAFARELRRRGRLMVILRGLLMDVTVADERAVPGGEGERAVLTLDVPGQEPAEVAFVREHGLYRIPAFGDFLRALSPAERAHRAGGTPRGTFEALMSCLADRAYGDVWELLAPELRDRYAKELGRGQDLARTMPAVNVPGFERDIGMTVKEYLGLGPRKLFAADLKAQLDRPEAARRRSLMLSRKFVRADVDGVTATAVLALPRRGYVSLRMKLVDGRWRFLEFK